MILIAQVHFFQNTCSLSFDVSLENIMKIMKLRIYLDKYLNVLKLV